MNDDGVSRVVVETTTGQDRRTWTFAPRALGLDLPPGPWDGEPDKIQWVDEATDLDCLMVRNPMAAWCGYVGVPRTHPLYGVGFEDVPVVDVHGGLTFSGGCAPGEPLDGICHIAAPGRESEPWWLGFDCGHWNDLQPGLVALLADAIPPFIYRNEVYVRAQCATLAAQLARAAA